jgi:hypothetical protein
VFPRVIADATLPPILIVEAARPRFNDPIAVVPVLPILRLEVLFPTTMVVAPITILPEPVNPVPLSPVNPKMSTLVPVLPISILAEPTPSVIYPVRPAGSSFPIVIALKYPPEPILMLAEPVPTLTVPVGPTPTLPMLTVLLDDVLPIDMDPELMLLPMVKALPAVGPSILVTSRIPKRFVVLAVLPSVNVPVVKLPPTLMSVPAAAELRVEKVVVPGKETVPNVAFPICTFPVPVMPKVTVPEEELMSKLFPVTPMRASPKFVLMAVVAPLIFTAELVSLELVSGCDIFYP